MEFLLALLFVVGCIYLLMFALVFCIAIEKLVPKFDRDPSCDNLETTNRWWLAMISPYHEFEGDRLTRKRTHQPIWWDCLKETAITMVYTVGLLAFFVPSVAVVALYATVRLIGEPIVGACRRFC